MASLSIDWNSALTNLLKVGGSIAETAITKTRTPDSNASLVSNSNASIPARGSSSSSGSNNLLLMLLPVGLVLLVVLLLKK